MGWAQGCPPAPKVTQATRDGGSSTEGRRRRVAQAMRRRWRTVMGPERMMSAAVSSSPSSPNEEVT